MPAIDQPITSAAMRAVIQERDDALPSGVSVCIPYFNEAPGILERAVSSVLQQTVVPREIIVVDDGSIHAPEAKNFPFLDDPLIRTVRITNRGLPAARNTALMLAKGEFFLPLDSDDWIDPRYLELTLPAAQNADAVVVGLQEHGDAPRNASYMPGFDRPAHEVTEKVLWNYNRYFYCALFRCNTLREVGGYHPAMAGWPGVNGGYEDWDLWIDLTKRKARIVCVNEILFHYNTGKGDESMLAKAERNRPQLVWEMERHHRR